MCRNMSQEETQKVAEQNKSKYLLGLLSAAFCKSVTVDLRGIKLTLKQPKYKDVLNVQLDTIARLGEYRKFILDPKGLEEIKDEKRQEEILEKTKDIRDGQTIQLLRLCCGNDEIGKEFKEELTEEMIKTIIQQTGGDYSPLVVAVKKLTGTYENDMVQDDPFFRRSPIQ